MLITVSKDKTALISFELDSKTTISPETAKCAISKGMLYFSDEKTKVKFNITEEIQKIIKLKGFFIYCTNKPAFDFHQVNLTK